MQGIPLPASTLSDILKEKDKWLALDITMSGITKKKNRAVLFPILEEHLVEWVDRANEQHVVVSDDVLRPSTEELISIFGYPFIKFGGLGRLYRLFNVKWMAI